VVQVLTDQQARASEAAFAQLGVLPDLLAGQASTEREG